MEKDTAEKVEESKPFSSACFSPTGNLSLSLHFPRSSSPDGPRGADTLLQPRSAPPLPLQFKAQGARPLRSRECPAA